MSSSDSGNNSKSKRTLTRIQLDGEKSKNYNITDLLMSDRNGSNNFCDVKVSNSSGDAILLHKCLFATISKYFDCLFQRMSNEGTCLQIHNGDEFLDIKSFVNDVYSGSLSPDSKYGEITKDLDLESDIGKIALDKKIRQLLNRDRQGLRKFCDAVISTETCDFPVHKCVVAAHSKFFLKLFTTEMKEKYEAVCHMTGIDAGMMRLVLDFIYTKEMWVADEQFADILSAADYLCIPSLQACHIADTMLDMVSTDNKMEMWLVGKKFNAEKLVTRAEKLIADCNSSTFDEDLVKVDRAYIKDFIKIFQNQVSPDGIYGFVMQWIKHDMDKRMDMFGPLFKIIDRSKLTKITWKKLLKEEVLLRNSIVASNAVLQYTKSFVPDDEKKVVPVAPSGHSSPMDSGVLYAVCGDTNRVYRCKLSSLAQSDTSRSHFKVPRWKQLECDEVWLELEDRHKFSLVYGGGRLYFLGGYDGDEIRATNEVVSCNDDGQWSYEPSMLDQRHSAGALYYSGKIYVAGGIGYNKKRLESMECYYRGQWTMLPSMVGCRAGLAFLPYNELLHVLGGVGRSNSPLLGHEIYSVEHSGWFFQPFEEHLTGIKLTTVHDGKAYIVSEDTDGGGMKLLVFDLKQFEVVDKPSKTAATIKRCAEVVSSFPDLKACHVRLQRSHSQN